MNDFLAFTAILGRHWAILPDTLDLICRISLRDGEGPEAVAKRLGHPLQNTRSVTVRDGVAIIPLTGPIFPRANTLSQISSGATSLQVLSNDLHQAIEDPNISAILLDVDSPGGVAFGPAEMAELIREANGIKPVTAYVSGMAASAAYWIASGAGEIVAHKSAMLGSIGVVTAMSVQEAPGTDGRRTIEIVSSNAKNKRPDPSTDEGKSVIREELDAIEAQFVGAVAANRSVPASTVLTRFGQGGMVAAEKAVAVGMADRLGTFEEVLARLAGKNTSTQNNGGTTMTIKDSTLPPQTSPQAPATGGDGVSTDLAQKLEAARMEGVTAERARIAGIESVAMPGYDALVAAAKADGKSTGADVALAIIAAQKMAGTAHLDALKQAEAALPVLAPSVDAAPSAAESALPIEDRCKAAWDRDPALRTEFMGDFGNYLAFEKQAAAGNIRIFSKKA
jgi:signal peptide peptidase SppA